MCGIIGYSGYRAGVPVVMEGLSRLEYRGYDSAGVVWQGGGDLKLVKTTGKLSALLEELALMPPVLSTCAMGHTRWATHGAPARHNAHPHLSANNSLAIVHNGIIENYQELKEELCALGYEFRSETDTEVLVNLIEKEMRDAPDLLHAFAAALKRARGAYAVCLMGAGEPDAIYAARLQAPLVFGPGIGENFVASDIPAFLPWTRKAVFLEDGDILKMRATSHEIYRLDDLAAVRRDPSVIQWDMQSARKDGYRHFMLKEIFEQPRVINDGLAGRLLNDLPELSELERMDAPESLQIVACGTSWHAGLWSRGLFENWAQIPVTVDIASEFRYRERLLPPKNGAALFISQSGETADTLAALRRAKSLGTPTIGLCNVVGSSLAREADSVIFTQAGPEISVASTKAMISQMLALSLMAIHWGLRRGTMDEASAREQTEILRELPSMLDDLLPEMQKKARELAIKYADAKNFFYLGRGHSWALALEGALKLKELSYIHAEGYAAGEMKHGPIALVDRAFPTFALAPDDSLFAKTRSNIMEVRARNGKVILLTNPGMEAPCDDLWEIPRLPGAFSAFLALPALQLFSYQMADYLGKDVDQPRNLAKSVTVE